MKSTKTFNNISDKLKKEIPKLKPGERVLFQMLNGVPNPEPDDKERAKAPVLYGKIQVQTVFRIYDPYQKDSEGVEVGGYVDVGCVDSWIGDQPARYRRLIPGETDGIGFQGKFELIGGKIQDEELYEILWLSNQREDNPHRDMSIEPLFKIVDLKKESKGAVSRVTQLRKALEIIKDISPAKAREVMAALNQPDYQDDDVLKAKLGDFVLTNHEIFLKTYEDPQTVLKYTIKTAMDTGVLTHDFATGDMKLGSVKIGNLKVDGLENVVHEITRWISTIENGNDVLRNIENQVKAKEVQPSTSSK